MLAFPKDRLGNCKMATVVQLGLLGVLVYTIFLELGDAFVIQQNEDLRTMHRQSKKTDYFGVVERVTPIVYRISKNSSEPPKEISPLTARTLPKHVDFVLRRLQGSLSMRLHRMRDVIGSHTRVEWPAEGEVMESKVLSTRCVYHGKVDAMENSLATIDLCDNMKGIIRTDDEDIYLQPLMEYTERNDDTRRYRKTHSDGHNTTHMIRIHRRQPEQPLHFTEGAAINLTHDTSQMDDGNRRMDGAKERRHRARRQALHRGPRYMQVLLVTDGSLVRFHGRDLIEQYLLTQMSIVDSIYHHPSLGFEINLIVVKIRFIDDPLVRHLVSKGDGKTSLDRFCNWANGEKPKNKNRDEDFDVAVYITKEEIGPAGYAPVTGMCNPMRSCALVKDDGTSSAFVIAHEIGHIFGMIHDGQGNECSDDPSDGKIMASMVQSNYHTYYWSPCNKKALEKYLVDVHCLDDKPKDPSWPVYSQPFGQSWSLDEQCRQEFGSGFSLCRAFDHLDPCYHLWCSHSSNQTLCKTKRGPPLPGTSCGRGKWCMYGSCLEKRTVSVDGGWSPWQRWEACSRTCGVGLQFRVRSCTEPRPKHGGKDCKGDREEFRTCNTRPCSELSDIREEQCAEFNEKRFDQGRRHHWLPMENKNDTEMCKMTCISMETGAIFVSESNAIDGTFCSYDQPQSICVKGTCHPVGCDGQLKSQQRSDQCGRCSGNGSTCRRVTGQVEMILSKKEYHRILVVPAKARNIAIRETNSAHHLAHFIAVRDTATERWYLNGNTQQGPSKQFVAHGTGFTYTNKQMEGESLTATGPLLAPVDIMIYSMSSKLQPAIDYEYSIPLEVTHRTSNKIVETRVESELSRYVWAVSGWTNCSKPCGKGAQFEVFTCVDTEKRQYSDGFCSYLTKPVEARKECNVQPCGLYVYWWDADDWSTVVTCSASCGSYGVQQRRVQCVTDNRGQTRAVEPAYCNQRHMPAYVQPCNRFPCTTPEAPTSTPVISTTTVSSTSVTAPETILPTATSQRHSVVESVTMSSGGLMGSTDSGGAQYDSTQYLEEVPNEVRRNVDVGEPREENSAGNSGHSITRSERTTTTSSEILTSATSSEVHGDNVSNILRLPFERNELERIPSRGSVSETDGREAEVDEQSTPSPTFENEGPRSSATTSQPELVSSSTAQTLSVEDEELLPFSRNLEEATPRVRTSHRSSFDVEETDDSSSSDSDIDLGLLLDRTTSRSGNMDTALPRSNTSVYEVSPPFQPVDPPVIKINRIERRRSKLEDGRLTRNYDNEKAVYGREASVSYGSKTDTTGTPIPTSTSTTRTAISTTVTPTLPITKTPTLTTFTSTTATSTATTVAPTSTTETPTSATSTTKAPSTTTKSVHPIVNAAVSTNPAVTPQFTGSGTSLSFFVARPLKAKTTIRKYPRKFSNFHAQPEGATQTIQEGGAVAISKMVAATSQYHTSPSTGPPYPDCISDRSIMFCKAGANEDRCSKPTFYTLCCISCRAFFSAP